MDLTTLFLVYAAVLLVCAGALIIVWRQNPAELGARSWAIGSVLGAAGLVGLAAVEATGFIWFSLAASLTVVAGLAHYALGTRQFVTGIRSAPRWFIVLFLGGAVAMALGMVLTPYGKGGRMIVGSLMAATYIMDGAITLLRRRESRTAPGYFLAFFFTLLASTMVVRAVMTLLDPGLVRHQPIEHIIAFVGVVGTAAKAMGFSMLITARLLADRKRHLDELEASVDDLRQQFEGLAGGDYAVRARLLGKSAPMDGLASLFNRTAEQVGAAFGEIDRQRSVLEATLESMLDGLLLLDRDGHILRVNPAFAALIGHGSEALVGSALADFVVPADRAFVEEIVAPANLAPVRERPVRFVTAAGDAIRLTINASPHRNEAQEVLGVVLVARDQRDLEDARAQLQIADRMAAMGTVAAGVAHEINNPLAFVVGNIDFALEELHASEGPLAQETVADIVEALEAAHRGGERVRRIVKDLKTLTRAGDDAKAAVDVNALVESAVAMLDNEIRHHARLERDLKAVPPVDAGETKLAQVFLNLIHNAAQAIAPGRVQENVIRVRSGLDAEGQVVVEVEDTGEGIVPEHLERIFDAFFTTKPVGVGTGLGLAICHREVTAIGGRIEVESEPGRGTTFRVVLPPAAAAEATPAAETPVAAPVARRRILVVDDEVEVGNPIRRILGRAHSVEIVSDPREALSKVLGGAFDVILCDLMMPEMTGMQLHAEISKQDPALAGRMVFLSGGAFSPGVAEFLRAYPGRVLHKPFESELLRRMVVAA
jgi:two-component system, NtrC family, sensor kinase